MTTILDVAAVAILLVSILTCCIKGFVRTVFGFAGTALALILAIVVALAAGESAYNHFVKQDVLKLSKTVAESIDPGQLISEYMSSQGIDARIDTNELNKAISDEDGTVSKNTADYMKSKGIDTKGKNIEQMIDEYMEDEELSGKLTQKAQEHDIDINVDSIKSVLKDSKDEIMKTLKGAANKDKDKAAQYIEENVIGPAAKKLTRYGVGLLTFLFCKLMFMVITLLTGVMKKFDLVKSTDMLLGAALGLLSGVVSVLLIAYSFSVFLNITNGGVEPVTKEMIDQTIVFKIFIGLFY
ncbi:MAG: hypothetical protein IJ696_03400 [Ruminococcus sp.]|nr:hypothetical protein [Ruminococcus sp.]